MEPGFLQFLLEDLPNVVVFYEKRYSFLHGSAGNPFLFGSHGILKGYALLLGENKSKRATLYTDDIVADVFY